MNSNNKIFRFEDALQFCTKRTDDTQDSSPRPALYKATMGKMQKKATRMQSGQKNYSNNFLNTKIRRLSKIIDGKNLNSKKGLIVFLFIGLIIASCYMPAKTYYLQTKETSKLGQEYSLVQARNEKLKNKVDELTSNEGIEASAHTNFGYVKDGEGNAYVQGIQVQRDSNMVEYVDPEDISAPSYWYTPLLDFIFNYKD